MKSTHPTIIIESLSRSEINVAKAISPVPWIEIEKNPSFVANCHYWEFVESIAAARRVLELKTDGPWEVEKVPIQGSRNSKAVMLVNSDTPDMTLEVFVDGRPIRDRVSFAKKIARLLNKFGQS